MEVSRGRKLANLMAAASMDEAAPRSSFSAMTVGSSGSSQSVPEFEAKTNVKNKSRFLSF